ncbi:acyl-CoA synthetase [Dechloromonas denitrificans]|uniref:LpxL/LpxP family acyltransferase n=1 Tax=Dechloromonas denitrificans TaxID=281362 RepID=UPI001CFB3FDB|nr:acyl-CoA synthetase [Dechloromonas denitrificans]UCV07932.1 acyl-CoA synthetase [Dechloromonas denitrificans]
MTADQPGGAEWRQEKEKSNLAILRLMVWISLTFGRRIGRLVLYGIAAYYVLCAPKARNFSRAYLHRALGRWAEWSDGFRHVLSFASTVHDRIYLLNDRFDLFDIEVIGAEALHAALEKQPGALLIGAHLGSFEVLRAVGRGRAGLKVAMLMYEENARKINATLAAINPAASEDIIPLGRMDSMLQARDRLDEGYLVGMLADRGLGDDSTVDCDFLGEMAPFPVGPFRIAAMLRRPVFFMTGLYLGGNRYQIHFEALADFSDTPREARQAAMRAAQQAYAERLSHFCRLAPYNWFNFFDFWQKK